MKSKEETALIDFDKCHKKKIYQELETNRSEVPDGTQTYLTDPKIDIIFHLP